MFSPSSYTAEWLPCNSAHNTPNTFCLCDASAVSGLSHVIAPGGMVMIDISTNIQFKQLTNKSVQQNEGHLPLVPHCTNQRNKRLYSFFFSPTDCIRNHLPKHPDKAAPPRHTNIIMRLKPTQCLRIYNDMYSSLQIYSTGSPPTAAATWEE
jgi:hypothetical protein